MSKDLESITRLEKKIGKKLKLLDFREIIGPTNGYALDEKKRVIGLNLFALNLSDISGLKELKNLTTLSLARNQISDISGLSELRGLTTLTLRKNNISKLPIEVVQLGMEMH